MENSKKRPRTWERRMEECKKKHRPNLRDWSRDGFASSRKENFDSLKNSGIRNDVRQINYVDETLISDYSRQYVYRIDSKNLSVNDFICHFEDHEIPLIIQNIPYHEQWKAHTQWTFKHLKDSFKDRYFKCGEDDDGYKIKIKMRYYLKYIQYNQDDSPLYIFDSNYDTDIISKQLLTEYKVPSYFPHDLFSLINEKRRPPYRWFLVGPQRSGSTVHIDPLGTSAWNTLLKGIKRWVLFPPGTSKDIVKGKTVRIKGEDDEAINYFIDHIPRIQIQYPNIHMIEFLQYEGDTVYIPGGWWHAVLNLTDTIAVTQNFCSQSNFPKVWRKTRKSRPKMSVKWLQQLHVTYPHLAEIATKTNENDNFTMYTKKSKDTKAIKNEDKKKKKDKKMHNTEKNS